MVYNMTKFRQNIVRSIKQQQNKNNFVQLYRSCMVIYNFTKIVPMFIFNCASIYWVQLYRLYWSFNFKHRASDVNRARLACSSQKSGFARGATTNCSKFLCRFLWHVKCLNSRWAFVCTGWKRSNKAPIRTYSNYTIHILFEFMGTQQWWTHFAFCCVMKLWPRPRGQTRIQTKVLDKNLKD